MVMGSGGTGMVLDVWTHIYVRMTVVHALMLNRIMYHKGFES